jgi:hypothetical protein
MDSSLMYTKALQMQLRTRSDDGGVDNAHLSALHPVGSKFSHLSCPEPEISPSFHGRLCFRLADLLP